MESECHKAKQQMVKAPKLSSHDLVPQQHFLPQEISYAD